MSLDEVHGDRRANAPVEFGCVEFPRQGEKVEHSKTSWHRSAISKFRKSSTTGHTWSPSGGLLCGFQAGRQTLAFLEGGLNTGLHHSSHSRSKVTKEPGPNLRSPRQWALFWSLVLWRFASRWSKGWATRRLASLRKNMTQLLQLASPTWWLVWRAGRAAPANDVV